MADGASGGNVNRLSSLPASWPPIRRAIPLVETLFAQYQDATTGRRLYAMVESLAPTADGMRVAADAIAAVGHVFCATAAPLAIALRAACDAAHDQVRSANAPNAGQSLEERVYVGLTAVAVERDEMVIAQAPPSQAIVVQDSRLYAIPALDSWRGNYEAGDEDESPRPLGVGPRSALRLSSTTSAPGDRIVLCSSTLGACLSRGLDQEETEPQALVPALTGDAIELAADLNELAANLGAGRGLAACFYDLETSDHWIWTADLPDQEARTMAPTMRTYVVASNSHGPVHGPASALDATTVNSSPKPPVSEVMSNDVSQPETSISCDNDAQPQRIRWFGRSPETMDRIQIACVTAIERIIGRRGMRPRRGERRAPSLFAPGARSMHMYRNSVSNPFALSVRAHLPRGPMVHIPMRLLTILLVAILVFAGAGYVYDRNQEREARAEQFLAKADDQLRVVTAAGDVGSVSSALGAAQLAIDGARDNGAGGQVVARRQAAVDAARDALRGVDRLENATRLGTLPSVDGETPHRLILIGSDLYLLSDALYHVDAQSRSLTTLLAPGMRIERATVHKLRDVTLDNGVLTVTDGLAIYQMRPDATWDRKRIGRVDEKTPWDVTACAAFDGSFYLLDGDNGQILKFPADRLATLPSDWAGADARVNLAGALDMVIDGRIFVLLENGTIQKYYRGGDDGALTVEMEPGLSNPVALFGGADTAHLYVADGGEGVGRITRMDRSGEDIRQYLLQSGAPDGAADAFANIDDFVVHEAAGIIYLLSGNQLWSATLPAAESVAQSG